MFKSNQVNHINRNTLSVLFQIFARLDESQFEGNFKNFIDFFTQNVNFKKLDTRVIERIGGTLYPGEFAIHPESEGVFVGVDGRDVVVFDTTSNTFVYDRTGSYCGFSSVFIEECKVRRSRKEIIESLTMLNNTLTCNLREKFELIREISRQCL